MTTKTLESLRALVDPATWFYYEVAPGSRSRQCDLCPCIMYFGKTPKGKSTPVDCDAPGGVRPTATEPGRGVSHFKTCPEAKHFSGRSRER
jgi:hypothetical protein